MTIGEACSICFKKGIKVYPVKVGGTWRINVKEEGKSPIRYNKSVTEGKETNEAMTKTYIFLAKKIIAE